MFRIEFAAFSETALPEVDTVLSWKFNLPKSPEMELQTTIPFQYLRSRDEPIAGGHCTFQRPFEPAVWIPTADDAHFRITPED
jgi:hypothetical protein